MTLYTVTSVCEGLLTPGTERLDKNDSYITLLQNKHTAKLYYRQ